MSSKLVAFLIGPSDSIGAALIKTWKTNGYAVAIGSRSLTEKKDGADYATKIDVTSPKSITEAFSAVTKDVGAPNVVVYNTAQLLPAANPDDVLATLDEATYEGSLKIGAGVFYAAQEALKGFRSAHSSNPKSFIVSGNPLAFSPAAIPILFGLALQKKISAHTIEQLYNSYTDKEDIRFHFAYVVKDDGSPIDYPDFKAAGDAHATAYWHLSSATKPEPWTYKFKLDGGKVE